VRKSTQEISNSRVGGNVIQATDAYEGQQNVREVNVTGNIVQRAGQQTPMIKILFLGANPANTTRLALDRETREIARRLRGSTHGEQFDVVQEWAVRIGDLQEALLRHKPDIVHFSGHGSSVGEIIVEDESGAAVPIPPEALSNLFAILRGNIRCVVLNACYSEMQADLIAQHIDCVVGMTTAVRDTAAIAFSGAFYQGLGFEQSVGDAFRLGCNEVALMGLPDKDTPRLKNSAGVNPESVFLRVEGAKLPRTEPGDAKDPFG
jgi:hypothetical protein